MKPIHSSLKKWMDDNDNFKNRLEMMKQEVLKHPRIKAFLSEHLEITDKHIEKRLNKLYEYTTQSIQCDRCKNYETCKNIVKGYSPILEFVQDEIHLSYEKCRNHLFAEKQSEKAELIQSIYIPKEILKANMSELFSGAERIEAIKTIDQFLNEAKKSLPSKGMFFTGPFGVGKTYLLGAIANELQKSGIGSTIVYMPELVRSMHEAIADNTVQEKMQVFKETEVLMLDDIGAETMSAWFRDEVLGAILQYRMMENLPVFFTSNYTMEQLETVLAMTSKGNVEQVKAGRIMERIRQVSQEITVGGANRRR